MKTQEEAIKKNDHFEAIEIKGLQKREIALLYFRCMGPNKANLTIIEQSMKFIIPLYFKCDNQTFQIMPDQLDFGIISLSSNYAASGYGHAGVLAQKYAYSHVDKPSVMVLNLDRKNACYVVVNNVFLNHNETNLAINFYPQSEINLHHTIYSFADAAFYSDKPVCLFFLFFLVF